MKYRKKPVVIEAHQWFKDGDHPEVRCEDEPNLIGSCVNCGEHSRKHAWINTLEGLHRVCPGDFIIKGVKGEFYPCKPDIFEMTYEKVEE